MFDIFVDPNENINVTVYFRKGGRHCVAFSEKDFEKQPIKDEEKAKFQKVSIQMRPLTWGLYNSINESGVVKNMSGDRDWNYKLYKENKLKSIIMGWDAKKKNTKGELEPVAVTPETIMSLAPEIAEVLLNSYDEVSLLDEDAEKK